MTLDEMWEENGVDEDETVDVLETDNPKKKSYFTDDCYQRDYWQPLTDKELEAKILMDPVAEVILKKEKLAKFLNKRLDPNALMVLNNMAFVYESEYDESEVRDTLEDLYSDEYAREIGCDTLGVTWVERQVVIVNLSNLFDTSYEISQNPDEYRSFRESFYRGYVLPYFMSADTCYTNAMSLFL